VKDRQNCEWLATANNVNDTVLIGIRIDIGNSERLVIGYKKLPPTHPNPCN
jgi:hypothetical protein